MTPRVRIAPSPTGDPHVGTAYVALFNRAFADREGGTFVLRIDDTDRARYRAESERAIFRALRWMGLDWDEGPDKGGPYAPYRQSERTDLYRNRVDSLLERGVAYRCFCSAERLQKLREQQLAEKRSVMGYDRRCRDLSAEEVESHLAAGKDHVVRLKVPTSGSTSFRDGLRGEIRVDNENIDDQVLLKSDGFPTYHLANVVDDSAMGITHVVRAEEWVVSTPKHILIYDALGERPPQFFHVPLLRNADHSKISKRKNPVSLDWYRQEGYLPEALRNFLANMGWSAPNEEEIFDAETFRDAFRLEDIRVGGPVFDLVKLRWMNGVYIRALDPRDLAQRLEDEGFIPAGVDPEGVARILPLVSERLHLLSEFEPMTRFFFGEPDAFSAEDLLFKKRSRDETAETLRGVRELLGGATDWRAESLESALESFLAERGLKKPELFMPLRVALTGRKDAPSIYELLEVLGRERCTDRIAAAERRLGPAAGTP